MVSAMLVLNSTHTKPLNFLQASTTGEISFQHELNSADASIPVIAPQWFVNHSGNTLFARIASDNHTLERVRAVLISENSEMTEFLPSLVVLITWYNNDTTKVRECC